MHHTSFGEILLVAITGASHGKENRANQLRGLAQALASLVRERIHYVGEPFTRCPVAWKGKKHLEAVVFLSFFVVLSFFSLRQSFPIPACLLLSTYFDLCTLLLSLMICLSFFSLVYGGFFELDRAVAKTVR